MPGAGVSLNAMEAEPVRGVIWIIRCVVLAGVVGLSGPAHAYELVKREDLTLDIFGWARAGHALIQLPNKELEDGPYIGLARLAARASWTGFGEAFIQSEGLSEDVLLLDLIAELHPVAPLKLRFGKFRMPTSADLIMMPAPVTPFVNRSLLFGQVQNRHLGTELVLTHKVRDSVLTLQTGWFAPTANQKDKLPDEEGKFLSIRALWELEFGLKFHLAYSDLLLGQNVSVPSGGEGPGPVTFAERAVALDRQLDLAVMYMTHSWSVFAEGLVSLDTAEQDREDTATAAYLHALYRFEVGGGYALEPGGRYGFRRRDGVLTQRVTLGLNSYSVGDKVRGTLNYEYYREEGSHGHAAYVQMQTGF